MTDRHYRRFLESAREELEAAADQNPTARDRITAICDQIELLLNEHDAIERRAAEEGL